MKREKQEVNTDESYHRGLTIAQLQFELKYHSTPTLMRDYDTRSVAKRIALIKRILHERGVL